ncbi:hypothetical protein ACIP88_10380 [Streptomyces uncialis]|uniref:hypothetical protein n=1 Tax=Streptomyces uncialis TaxID=1048205 RepID=UPI00382E3088
MSSDFPGRHVAFPTPTPAGPRDPVATAPPAGAPGAAPAPTPATPAAGVPEDGTPADAAPLGVERAPTGHPEVDARLGRLADADHLATDGHLEVYEDVHRALRDTLTALDSRPGPPVPAPQRTPASSYDHRS